MILGKNQPKAAKIDKKGDRKAAAAAREREAGLRGAVKTAEAEMARLTAERSAIERAMFDPSTAGAAHAKLSMTDLMKLRAEVEGKLEAAEAAWVKASEALDAA